MEPSLISFTYSEVLALKELYPSWNTYRLAAVSNFALDCTQKNIIEWVKEFVKKMSLNDSSIEFMRELLNARHKFLLEGEHRVYHTRLARLDAERAEMELDRQFIR